MSVASHIVQPSPFRRGLLDALPIAAGYIPIAISFGALGIQSEFGILACLALSALVFAGASQFVALGLIAAGADALQIVLGTFFLNLRHLIMSMSLRNRAGRLTHPSQKFSALLITDETYALTANKGSDNIRYFLGVGLCAYLAWVLGTLIGAYFARYIPGNITASFVVVLYAMFIALLVPGLQGSRFAVLACGISLIVNAALYSWLGSGWSIIIATLVASVTTGFIVEKKNGSQLHPERDTGHGPGDGDTEDAPVSR